MDQDAVILDSAAGRQIIDLLRELRSRLGLTVILVTHDAAIAAHTDRRLHLVDGRLSPAGLTQIVPSQPTGGASIAGEERA